MSFHTSLSQTVGVVPQQLDAIHCHHICKCVFPDVGDSAQLVHKDAHDFLFIARKALALTERKVQLPNVEAVNRLSTALSLNNEDFARGLETRVGLVLDAAGGNLLSVKSKVHCAPVAAV